jgi:hypothetical protein
MNTMDEILDDRPIGQYRAQIITNGIITLVFETFNPSSAVLVKNKYRMEGYETQPIAHLLDDTYRVIARDGQRQIISSKEKS